MTKRQDQIFRIYFTVSKHKRNDSKHNENYYKTLSISIEKLATPHAPNIYATKANTRTRLPTKIGTFHSFSDT